MELRRLYLILKIFLVFIVVLITEYLCSGIYFRLVRESDFIRADWICGISAPLLCLSIFWKSFKSALKEGIPPVVVALFFLFFTALLGFFIRYSLQLANGLLDGSVPEKRVITVVSKKISPFGGRIKDGVNPAAYMIYFQDWENSDEGDELLTSHDFYYSVDDGSMLELIVRRGFFRWAWVQDFQVVTPPRLNRPKSAGQMGI